MLVVEPLRLGAGEEKLAPVAVRPAVGRAQQPWARVFRDEVFVVELCPVDGEAARAVALEKVPALDHEILDDAVELDVLVSLRKPALLVLTGAELSEVLARLGRDVGEQLHLDPPDVRASDGDVEKHHGIVRIGRPLVPLRLRHAGVRDSAVRSCLREVGPQP